MSAGLRRKRREAIQAQDQAVADAQRERACTRCEPPVLR